MDCNASMASRDWQCNKSLTECLEHMLKSNIDTDVTFLVGEERKVVHAHKLILTSRSPVFYAMLEGPMSEKGDITVPDIEEKIFNLFLGYLYTDKISLDIYSALGVLAAARKYCVDILLRECEKFIKENMTVENVGVLLEDAHFFMEEETKGKCLQLIWYNPEEFLKSKHFGHLCSDCVKSVTDSDDLAVKEEEHVYEAVLRWSEEECARQGLEVNDENRKEVIGDILYTIRFPLLNKDFFTEVVSMSDLLTSDDIVSVLRLKSGKGKVLSQNIKTKKRNENQKIHRVMYFSRVCSGEFSANILNTSILSFKVSNDVTLRGISVYSLQERCPIFVDLYDGNNVLSYNTPCKIAPQGNILDVFFNEKFCLMPSHTYTLSVHAEKKFLYYGRSGRNSVTVISTEINFMSTDLRSFRLSHFGASGKSDNINGGPIAGILLSGL